MDLLLATIIVDGGMDVAWGVKQRLSFNESLALGGDGLLSEWYVCSLFIRAALLGAGIGKP